MNVLVKTKDLSRREWLHWRQQGIGGSDVSIIAGINPYKSIYNLWLEKTGQIEPEETHNDYVHFGSILEPIVKQEFMARTGLKVRAKNVMMQSSEYQFMIADVDGVIYENSELCIFEAKTASAWKEDVWKTGIPMEYMLQIQHYMAVTGAKKTYIAALVGGNRFYYHMIPRDEELISQIIALELEFWEINVLGGIEPVADGSEATTKYLNDKYNTSNGDSIMLPEETISIFEQYDEVNNQYDEIKKRRDSICNQFKSYLKENEVGYIGNRKISWKQIHKTTFDKKRFEQEQPDTYKDYLLQSSYRRLSIA